MAIVIRHSLNTLRTIRIQSVFHRSISMSAKLRAKEAIEEMKKQNPYYEKYASKLASVQQKSPEEFMKRLDTLEKEKHPSKKTEKER